MNLHETLGYKDYMAILCMCAREGPVYSVKVTELCVDDRWYIMKK